MRAAIAMVVVLVGALAPGTASAQAVKHIQTKESGIATGVWVGNTLYLSGQLPTLITPADREKGTPAVYGNTQVQAESVFIKIQNLLKDQGLGMGDVVMMRVYMAADPAMGHKLDFAGMNAAYAKFFGTAEQPNKPARSTFQVAALVAPGALLEIEVQAARSTGADAAVFTASQADAGKVAYGKACASCHMPDLRGNADVPPLAGPNFMSAWGARTTKELFDYIVEVMPPGGPSQSRESYAAILAHLLRSNGATAGTDELAASTVVRIERLVQKESGIGN